VSFRISKDFAFSASHQLAGLPIEHKCARLHGHNYVIKIVLQGITNEVGFVVDYAELDAVKLWIDAYLDHRCLGCLQTEPDHDHPMEENPTAENLAFLVFNRFWEQFPEMIEVGVSETPNTWAVYAGE
jgi:6-pyruvoyltetrahydropterin/6-carboxytetrahydropterin synthase